MRTPLLAAALALFSIACQSTDAEGSSSLLAEAGQATDAPEVQVVDAARREALFSVVSALEGEWKGEAADGQPGVSTFEVTSNGSAVRETMLPGTPYEMTNMYTLDGNALVMTHYCAGGNQPTMRAESFADGRCEFRFEGVRDLKAEDEVYMGEMTLVIVDEDTIEQHWRALKGGELDHDMVIKMARVK